jgi:vacuolar-type H+-ATPase subunit E/Vma4
LALDQLITALEEDAEKQAHTELEQARSEAHRIATHARDLIVRRRAEFLVRMENDLREETEIELVEARRRSRSIVLGARQRLLDRVFTAAEARLPSLLEQRAYRDALPEELRTALSYVGDEPATIACSPQLSGAIEALVAGRAGTTVLPDDSVGSGFKVVSADGYVTVDVTLDARLERLRPQLSLEVLRELETAPAAPGPAAGP